MGNDNIITQKAILVQMDIYDKQYPFYRNFQCPDNLVGIYQVAMQDEKTDIHQYRFKCRAFSKINHQNIIPMQFKIITTKQICSESVSYQLHYNYIRDKFKFPLEENEINKIQMELISILKYLRTLKIEIVLNKNNLGNKQNKLKYLVRFGESKFGNEKSSIENKVFQFLNQQQRKFNWHIKQQLKNKQSLKRQAKINSIKNSSKNNIKSNNSQNSTIANRFIENQELSETKTKENLKKIAVKLPRKLQLQQQFNNQSKSSINLSQQQNSSQWHRRQLQQKQRNENLNYKRQLQPQYRIENKCLHTNQQQQNIKQLQPNKNHINKSKFQSKLKSLHQQKYYQQPPRKLQKKIQQPIINKLKNCNQQIKNKTNIIKCENNLVKIQVPPQLNLQNYNLFTQNLDSKQYELKNINKKIIQRGELKPNKYLLYQSPSSFLQIKNPNMQINNINSSRPNRFNRNVFPIVQPRINSVNARLGLPQNTSIKYRKSVSKQLKQQVNQQNLKRNQFQTKSFINFERQNNLDTKVNHKQPFIFLVNQNKLVQYDSVYGRKQRQNVILGTAINNKTNQTKTNKLQQAVNQVNRNMFNQIKTNPIIYNQLSPQSSIMYGIKHTIQNNKYQNAQNKRQQNQLNYYKKYSALNNQNYQRMKSQGKSNFLLFNKQDNFKKYEVIKSTKGESERNGKFENKNQNKKQINKSMMINQLSIEQKDNYHRRQDHYSIKEGKLESIHLPNVNIKIQGNHDSLYQRQTKQNTNYDCPSSPKEFIIFSNSDSQQQTFQLLNQLKKNNRDLQLKVEYLTNQLLKLKNQNSKQEKIKIKQNQINVNGRKSFGNFDAEQISRELKFIREKENKEEQKPKQQAGIQILQTQFMNRYKNQKNKQLLERLIKAIDVSKKVIKDKQNQTQ